MRMRLAEELAKRGYDFGPQAFEEVILGVFEEKYSDWTDEELICNTPEADKFVKAVRQRFGGLRIPHWLVNQTLINLRKRSKLERRTSRRLKAAAPK